MKRMFAWLAPAWDDATWLGMSMLGMLTWAAMLAISSDTPMKLRWEMVVIAGFCAVLSNAAAEVLGSWGPGDTAEKREAVRSAKVRQRPRRYLIALIFGLGWQGLMPAVISGVQRLIERVVSIVGG